RQFRAPACMLGAQNGRRIQRRDTCLLERANETIAQSRQLATERRALVPECELNLRHRLLNIANLLSQFVTELITWFN
ncbi:MULTISPECIES: hypothetical protein, partial [unclassified Bradyrhizobium]|uniref:hypothetical protein n=1 Tax=unclassified Bradyrhizobium TaxID=2631580 RepID=UPI001FFA1F67